MFLELLTNGKTAIDIKLIYLQIRKLYHLLLITLIIYVVYTTHPNVAFFIVIHSLFHLLMHFSFIKYALLSSPYTILHFSLDHNNAMYYYLSVWYLHM